MNCCRCFEPDFVLVSAGFDAAVGHEHPIGLYYCAILYYTVTIPYFIVLCTVLYCTTLKCTVLSYLNMYYSELYYTVL